MDEFFMSKAIELAKVAYSNDEVPVGAIVVRNNKIIGCGYNKKDYTKNPLNHAELLAIEEACKYIGDWRLNDCVLYTTLEPCMMCMGAVLETRICRIVFGVCKNEKNYFYNSNIFVTKNVLEDECLNLLQKFFKNKRN